MSLLTFDPIEGVKKKSEDAMKNSIMIITAALLIVGFNATSFAATYPMSVFERSHIVEGRVDSINTGNNTFVIQDKDDTRYYVVGARSSEIASLKKGDSVRVTLPCTSNLALQVVR